ncbi:PAS domain-containing protein [Opitutus terrae]|uniref:PAS domain-containing protein n=1 Tax=Opitutus terrae (strain DSM 11246 / JCM 15787 / PB90-1) TaxID=452637 RepID=B1ZNS6_OPITP|nr:PAS domain-containing protein [Opitutus terrae]ACB75446.1 hypothetical protein Oter_2163 [Opitutus terrae PB90-1]
MNESAPLSSPPRLGAIAEADLCAAVVLDATGKIVAVNQSARQLWSASDRSLIGRPFAQLFVLDAAPEAADAAVARWRILSAETLDRTTVLTALPLTGAKREVRVRLERAVGGAGSYLATVQIAPATQV